MIVACVLKSGGVYTPDWVRRLREGVAQHLKQDYKFVCLSDMEVPDRIPLVHDLKGWWSKIELFKLPGPVLYFDLDTMIVGDLSDIANVARTTDSLVMLTNFYDPKGYGSGVMAWGGDVSELHNHFAGTGYYKGDQDYIADNCKRIKRWQDILPGQFVSYKARVRKAEYKSESGNGFVPKDARVVCFHGLPKPDHIGWKLNVASDEP